MVDTAVPLVVFIAIVTKIETPGHITGPGIFLTDSTAT
jgi:hypothetical protein